VSDRFEKSPWPEIVIVCIAIVLRCWLIEIKPPHFDEGINGWFADQMTATGYYRYDPTNYHGPLHFYAVLLSQTLFGREIWALRLPAILASVLCIVAMLRFREFFGTGVARLAALAMAVSPGFVFYGRYSIHESWQVLFSILFLHGLLGLWMNGTRRDFFTLIAAVAGMILTKETYLVHLGCFTIAVVVLWGWQRLVPSLPSYPIATQKWRQDDVILGIGIAALIITFFYSGTFRDFGALRGLYQTFTVWVKTGVDSGGHHKTAYDLIGPLNYYWIAIMGRYEWPALAGVMACLRYMLPSDTRWRFIAIASTGTLLAYSLISYKTPWCIISIIWPFYLMLGSLLKEWADRTDRRLVWILAGPLIAVSLWASIQLNFFYYTDDSEPYVYVQTLEDIRKFTDPVLTAAKSEPDGYQMKGSIILDSYYPLPWMLGDFTRVGYYKKDVMPTDWDFDFVVVDTSMEADMEKKFTQPFYKIPFRLRSGQDDCTAYLSVARFSKILGNEAIIIPKANTSQ
jgi:uncharacterized protein (TIGR03663 family)